MDKRLEEIQGKFDVMQNSNDSGQKIVMHLMGSMDKRIKLRYSFEVFYDFITQYPILSTINYVLREKEINPLTEEDLEYLYKNMQKNFEK